MRAILWMSQNQGQPMAQLLDRPFVQHVVEQLVERGVTRIELYARPSDDEVVRLLGDGARWGIEIQCLPVERLEEACGESAQLVLFGNACCLPALPSLKESAKPAIFFHDESQISRWSGWVLAPERPLADFVQRILDGGNWREAIRAARLQVEKVFLEGPSLCACSGQDILDANRVALDGGYPGLFFDGTERQPRVWVAKGAKVPDSAVLQSPCYIGHDAWIGEDCRVGPHVVIGRECAVERGTAICNSVVGEGTFLGHNLVVADSVVNRNRIHNVRLDATLEIEEEYVASALTGGPIVSAWLKRAGLVALLLCSILTWVLAR